MSGTSRQLSAGLTKTECDKLGVCWLGSRHLGFPLDLKVDIRPAVNLDATEGYKYFDDDWNWLGQWCRRNVGHFYAIATREAFPHKRRPGESEMDRISRKYGTGHTEHYHHLIHLGHRTHTGELREKLRAAWKKRRRGNSVVVMKPANYGWQIDPVHGYRGSAFLYITKQRESWEMHLPRIDRVTLQHGGHPGRVLGRRCKISLNLDAAYRSNQFKDFTQHELLYQENTQ